MLAVCQHVFKIYQSGGYQNPKLLEAHQLYLTYTAVPVSPSTEYVAGSADGSHTNVTMDVLKRKRRNRRKWSVDSKGMVVHSPNLTHPSRIEPVHEKKVIADHCSFNEWCPPAKSYQNIIMLKESYKKLV